MIGKSRGFELKENQGELIIKNEQEDELKGRERS